MHITAHAYREGRWWALSAPGHSGLFSQCRRLDQVEAMIKDAASLLYEVDEDSISVTVVPIVEGVDLDKMRAGLAHARKALREAEATVVAHNREAVNALRNEGLVVRDVAALLDLSPQRVSQIEAQSRRAQSSSQGTP